MWRLKAGGGVWGGGLVSPPQKIFEKSNLKSFILVHIWSNFEMTNKWFNCHFHEKSLVIVDVTELLNFVGV